MDIAEMRWKERVHARSSYRTLIFIARAGLRRVRQNLQHLRDFGANSFQ
jgi:hypothetical protein